jgi:hypothetical protein
MDEPHATQNFLASGEDKDAETSRGAPHPAQKFSPSSIFAPQFLQNITIRLLKNLST